MPPKYKHNMDLLMDLVQKNKLLEKSNPQYRKAIWEKITEKYNDANNSDFTKKQLSDRFQNYKRQLKDEKSNLKISQKKTGSGSPGECMLSDEKERHLNIMNGNALTFENSFDPESNSQNTR